MVATLFTFATMHKNNNSRQGQMVQRRHNDFQQQPDNIQPGQNLAQDVLRSYLQIRRSCISTVILMITLVLSSFTKLVSTIQKVLEVKITTSLVERRTSNTSLRSNTSSTWEAKARFIHKSLSQSSAGAVLKRSSVTMLTL